MKPQVICHMVTSVDGKILGDRWGKLPGGSSTADLFESTAASFNIPAWLVGTTTMREFMGRNQGGGRFNGAMLKAGLVDELSQIIVPIADGGGPEVTGVYDAPGEPLSRAAARLQLKSHQVLPGGAVWLRYRVTRRQH